MDKLDIYIRRAIRTLLTLLVLGVVANDGVRFYQAFDTANRGSKSAMSACIDAVRAQPDVSAEPLAAQAAAAEGATLKSFVQEKASNSTSLQVRVTLEVGVPVTKTLVVAPIIGLVKHVPSEQWYSPAGVEFTLPNSKVITELGVTL